MGKQFLRMAYYYQLLSSVSSKDSDRVMDWLIIIAGFEKAGILVEQKVKA